MNFGQRIKQLRTENCLTQNRLAEILDVSKSNISKYEAGNVEPNINILIRISEHFNVSVDYLLGCTDDRHPAAEYEWRYFPVSNRLGNILKKYREEAGLSTITFSKKLGITEDIYNKLETDGYSETYKLPYKLVQQISSVTGYDIDYILGASDHTVIPSNESIEINDALYPVSRVESNVHFKTKFEELCIENQINIDNVEEFLGITKKAFTDIRWNRMPTLSELLKIAYAFGVSMDYLIGKTDVRMSTLDEDELSLIMDYRDCSPIYKENIKKRARDLSIDTLSTNNSSSVAAEQPSRKTGTDNLGK